LSRKYFSGDLLRAAPYRLMSALHKDELFHLDAFEKETSVILQIFSCKNIYLIDPDFKMLTEKA
jgi:hypothetical protein